MRRTWKTVTTKTLLAAALAASPILAGTEGPPTPDQKLDAIQKQLDEMKKSLATVTKSIGALPNIEKGIGDLRAETNAAAQNALGQVADLQKELSRLKSEIAALKTQPSSPGRIAASPPTNSVGPGAIALTGRVQMINTYPTEVTIHINRVAYRVLPQETRMSRPVSAGSFTYQVMGVTEELTRPLAADEVFTIHVHP